MSTEEEDLLRQLIGEMRAVREDLLAAVREASEHIGTIAAAAAALLEHRAGNGPGGVTELRPKLRGGGGGDGDG